MTCCIVLINPAATAASLPPLTCSSSSLSSATIGTLRSRDNKPAPQQHKGHSSQEALPSPGMQLPAQATAVP